MPGNKGWKLLPANLVENFQRCRKVRGHFAEINRVWSEKSKLRNRWAEADTRHRWVFIIAGAEILLCLIAGEIFQKLDRIVFVRGMGRDAAP